MAVFFAWISRERDRDEEAAGFIEENEGFDLNGDNEQLRLLQVSSVLVRDVPVLDWSTGQSRLYSSSDNCFDLQGKSFATDRQRTQVNRLSKTQVAEAREIQLRRHRMWSFLREWATYVSFLTLLFLLVGIHRDAHSHQQPRHLRKYFLDPHRSVVNYAQVLFCFAVYPKEHLPIRNE